MSTLVVKICGIATVDMAQQAATAGADMIGLVFSESVRRVTPEIARSIVQQSFRPRPLFIGVFVDERPEEIERVVKFVGLDLVQLSGDEAVSDYELLTCPYLKTIHINPMSTVDSVRQVMAQHLTAVAFLLDSRGAAGEWGGSGRSVDVSLATKIVAASSQHVMLAGGLTPETVGSAIASVKPWGVDVSSGVETNGSKSLEKITSFVMNAKRIIAMESTGV